MHNYRRIDKQPAAEKISFMVETRMYHFVLVEPK